jgi:hypothetical protein
MALASQMKIDASSLYLSIAQLNGQDKKGTTWCRCDANLAPTISYETSAAAADYCPAAYSASDAAYLDLFGLAGTVRASCQALGMDVNDAAPEGVQDLSETVLVDAAPALLVPISCILIVLLSIVANAMPKLLLN